MIPHSRAIRPTIERTAPSGSSRGRRGVLRRRQEEVAGDEGDDHDRDVDQEDRAPPEVLEQEAAEQRAEGDADADATPAQMPMARARSFGSVKTLVRIDSVAGMISAAPMPMNARVAMSGGGRRRRRPTASEPTPKMARPMLSAPLRPKRSPRLPDGEEQAGEHERVAVDDPLQLAGRGVEVLDERGQGHVEDGVVEADDQQAEAQHAERPPAPVDGSSGHRSAPLPLLSHGARPVRTSPEKLDR